MFVFYIHSRHRFFSAARLKTEAPEAAKINGILCRLRKGNRMTHNDFNHLLTSIKGLSAEQLRQLREQLDKQLAPSKKPVASASGKAAKRAKATAPKKKPLTAGEFNQRLLAAGRIASLPDPALDIDDDDPDDQPITIEGEPMSETIIRERR
jgi:ElaB/YqjD/DUF883 family membrane-anchored ribosome-binding protein